jgi:hypothetical protein
MDIHIPSTLIDCSKHWFLKLEPISKTRTSPIEDFIIPDLPELPTRNEDYLCEKRKGGLILGKFKS